MYWNPQALLLDCVSPIFVDVMCDDITFANCDDTFANCGIILRILTKKIVYEMTVTTRHKLFTREEKENIVYVRYKTLMSFIRKLSPQLLHETLFVVIRDSKQLVHWIHFKQENPLHHL